MQGVSRTSNTANVVLGLLALRPRWSMWDLNKQIRRNLRFFWPRAESRIYEETRRLAAAGHATADHAFVGRRQRTEYAITAAGRDQLQRWLDTPPKPTVLECEALLRIVLSDLGTPAQAARALERLKKDAWTVLDVGKVVGDEYLAGTAPFQDQVHVRALLLDFLSSFSLMLLAWADRAEQRMGAWADLSPGEREASALEIVRSVLQTYPPEPAT